MCTDTPVDFYIGGYCISPIFEIFYLSCFLAEVVISLQPIQKLDSLIHKLDFV